MPARSLRQQRYMAMLAHDPTKRKAAGVSQQVAEEFARAPGGTTKGLPERKRKLRGR